MKILLITLSGWLIVSVFLTGWIRMLMGIWQPLASAVIAGFLCGIVAIIWIWMEWVTR